MANNGHHFLNPQGLWRGVLLVLVMIAASPVFARTVSPLPENLSRITEYRNFAGQHLYFRVTGSKDGGVWGSGIYTDDSAPGRAAVHAGLLTVGQTGVVKVSVLGAQTGFTGSTANGVSSSDYGAFPGSYRISADDGGDNPVLPDPGNLINYRSATGGVYQFSVKGVVSGSLWGTNTYTDDSQLAAVAVHMGVLGEGASGTVRVTLAPGMAAYAGSSRNGVSSRDYGVYPGSYTLNRIDGTATLAAYPGMKDNPLPDPGNMLNYASRIGAGLYFSVTGKDIGNIWGSGVYTGDSPLSKVALHTGVLSSGQPGTVLATVLAGQSAYSASTAHGITSMAYGPFGSSYSMAAGDGRMGTIPMVDSASTASAKVGEAFRFSFGSTPAATSVNATGLPEGLSHSGGVISGTPRISGTFPIDLLATGSVGSSSKSLLLSITADGSSAEPDPTALFRYAEATFASLFAPASQPTQNLFGYTLRYYPGTNTYLGIALGRVFCYGPWTGFKLLDVGSLKDLLAAAKAAGFQ